MDKMLNKVIIAGNFIDFIYLCNQRIEGDAVKTELEIFGIL